MNQNRRDQLVRGLPTLHKKVLDGVPMLQPMEKGKVCSEVIRASGTRIDQRTIYHVLGALRDQGLIREPSPNHFIQNAKKDKEEEDMAAVNKDRLPGPVTMILAPKPAPSPESDPLDRLSAVAEWLLTMAGEVSEIAKRVESDRAKGGSDSAKLRQLQALLKGE